MEKERRNSCRKEMHLFFILMGGILMSLALAGQVTAWSEESIVGVFVPTGTIGPGEAFTFEIYCHPGGPVRAFEVNFQFDSTLFEINTVSQGTLFTGYTSFFSEGVIDNTAGTVSGVLGVILGPGNVTVNGTLLSVSCTAKDALGTSTIDLYHIGLTDETQYVSLIVNDGSLTISSQTGDPLISSPDPANGSTDIPLSRSSLSISIESPDGDSFNYTIWTSPNIGIDTGVAETNGTKTCSISGLAYETTYHWYVCCRDSSSGNWTNRSFAFTTEDDPGSGDDNNNGGGAPPGGGGFPSPDLEPEDEEEPVQNLPPCQPLRPSGPVFIELGVEYEYTTLAYDVGGGDVRFRFDWGDSTSSNLTSYVASNTTVSMRHVWMEASTFSIRVLAQDTEGLESNWSLPLEVVVSQDTHGASPIAIVNLSEDVNDTREVFFNASSSYDIDGEIVSYEWDFGDGTTGIGRNIGHKYAYPGDYIVTLTLRDNDGNVYEKTMIVTIHPEGSAEENVSSGDTSLVLFVVIPLIIIGCVGIFIYLLRRHIPLFSFLFKNIRQR